MTTDPLPHRDIEELIRESRREEFRRRLGGALDRALIEALTFDELLLLLSSIWADPHRYLVLERLETIACSDEQWQRLAALLENLIEVQGLRPQHRIIAERAVQRLLWRIPRLISRQLILRCLGSHRTILRQAAYHAFRVHGVDPEAAGTLLEQSAERFSREALRLVASSPECMAIVNEHELLTDLHDERFWRTVAIQSLLSVDSDRAVRLAEDYPIAFIWAVARSHSRDQLPTLRRILKRRRADPEVVYWSIWALGRLGAKADLEEIMRELGHLANVDSRTNPDCR